MRPPQLLGTSLELLNGKVPRVYALRTFSRYFFELLDGRSVPDSAPSAVSLDGRVP